MSETFRTPQPAKPSSDHQEFPFNSPEQMVRLPTIFAISHIKREYSEIVKRFHTLRGFPAKQEASFSASNDAAYALISLSKDMLDHMEDREDAHSAAVTLTRKQQHLINQIGHELQISKSRISFLESAQTEILSSINKRRNQAQLKIDEIISSVKEIYDSFNLKIEEAEKQIKSQTPLDLSKVFQPSDLNTTPGFDVQTLVDLKSQASVIEELISERVARDTKEDNFSSRNQLVLQNLSSNTFEKIPTTRRIFNLYKDKENESLRSRSPVTSRIQHSPLTPEIFHRKKASLRAQLSHSPILQERKLILEQPFHDPSVQSPRIVRTTAKPTSAFGSARKNISFGIVAADSQHLSLRQENLTLKNELDLLKLQREEETIKENAILIDEIKTLKAKDEERKEKLRKIKENYRAAMEGIVKVTGSIEKIEIEARNVCEILKQIKLGEGREKFQDAIADSLCRLSSIENQMVEVCQTFKTELAPAERSFEQREAEVIQVQLNTAQSKIDKLESALRIVESENKKLLSQMQSRNMKIKQLQGTVVQNSKENERLKGCLDKLKQEFIKAEDNFKSIQGLLQKKLEKYKKQLRELKETQIKQDTHLKADQLMLSDVSQELRKAKVEITHLSKKNESLMFQNAKLSTDLDQTQQKADHAQKDIDELKDKIKALDEQSQRQNVDHKELRDQSAAIKKQEETLRATEQSNKEIKEQLDKVKAQVGQIQAEKQKQQKELQMKQESFEVERGAHLARISQLEAKINEKQVEISRYFSEHQSYRESQYPPPHASTTAVLTQELLHYKTSLRDMQMEAEVVRQNNRRLQNQLNETADRLDAGQRLREVFTNSCIQIVKKLQLEVNAWQGIREGIGIVLPSFQEISLNSSLAVLQNPEILLDVVGKMLQDARQIIRRLKDQTDRKFDAAQVLKEVDSIIEGVKNQVKASEQVKQPQLLNNKVEFIENFLSSCLFVAQNRLARKRMENETVILLKGELKPLVNLLVTSPAMSSNTQKVMPISIETNSTTNYPFHSNREPQDHQQQDTFRQSSAVSLEVSPIREKIKAKALSFGSAEVSQTPVFMDGGEHKWLSNQVPARNLNPHFKSLNRYETEETEDKLEKKMFQLKQKIKQRNTNIDQLIFDEKYLARCQTSFNDSRLNGTMRAVQQDCDALVQRHEQMEAEVKRLKQKIETLQLGGTLCSSAASSGIEVISRELRRLSPSVSSAASASKVLDAINDQGMPPQQIISKMTQCFVCYIQMSGQQIRLQQTYAQNINQSIRETEEQMLGQIQNELQLLGSKVCEKQNDIKKLYAKIKSLESELKQAFQKGQKQTHTITALQTQIKEQEVLSDKLINETKEQLNAALYQRKHIYDQLQNINNEKEMMNKEATQLRQVCHRQEAQLRETFDLNQRLNHSLVEIQQQNMLQQQQMHAHSLMIPQNETYALFQHPSRMTGTQLKQKLTNQKRKPSKFTTRSYSQQTTLPLKKRASMHLSQSSIGEQQRLELYELKSAAIREVRELEARNERPGRCVIQKIDEQLLKYIKSIDDVLLK